MLKRHEVQVLLKAGHTAEATAKLAGVSVSAVLRIAKEAAVAHVDDAAERRRRGVGRPSKAEPFRAFVSDLLQKEQGLLSLEILRRAKLIGYKGSKTALYDLVATLRPKDTQPVVRFEGLPGEFTQHDFGHVDVRFIDGGKLRVHFFASRLKYSRTVAVTLVPNEQAETLVRTLVEHFVGFGGIPLLAVFDRPKTVCLTWRKNGEVTDWNPIFAGVALDLGLGVEVCWPRAPWQKGSVENLVGWVKGSFFKQRRFVDLDDVLCQLKEWHVEVNTVRPSRATERIPAELLVEERARLRPLKIQPDDLALKIPVLVGPTGMVLHETNLYSMPPTAIGTAGILYLYKDKVRIVCGRHEAVHERQHGRKQSSRLPDHRSESVAAVAGQRGKRYLQRQHLLEIGQEALDYLTELTHRRPQRWMRDIEALHDLLQVYGKDALREAFAKGLKEHTIGAEYIAHYVTGAAWSASPRGELPQ